MCVVTAFEASWIEPFSGLPPRTFAKLVRQMEREGADAPRKGRPWGLPFADRVLLVAAYWRTNLTMRQIAPLFGVSKSAADRIIDDLGPKLALRPRQRFARDTVLIVDGTLVPTRDRSIAAPGLSLILAAGLLVQNWRTGRSMPWFYRSNPPISGTLSVGAPSPASGRGSSARASLNGEARCTSRSWAARDGLWTAPPAARGMD